jgi:hypothetical protein
MDAVAASWTMLAEEDGYVLYRSCVSCGLS